MGKEEHNLITDYHSWRNLDLQLELRLSENSLDPPPSHTHFSFNCLVPLLCYFIAFLRQYQCIQWPGQRRREYLGIKRTDGRYMCPMLPLITEIRRARHSSVTLYTSLVHTSGDTIIGPSGQPIGLSTVCRQNNRKGSDKRTVASSLWCLGVFPWSYTFTIVDFQHSSHPPPFVELSPVTRPRLKTPSEHKAGQPVGYCIPHYFCCYYYILLFLVFPVFSRFSLLVFLLERSGGQHNSTISWQ